MLIVEKLPRVSASEHRNVKAIITNGEKLILHEAAWFHKPIIGIPWFGDHFQNIAKIVSDGVGIQLDYKTMTVDDIVAAINEIENQKYFDAMYDQSMRLGSNLAHPLEIADYFIEHVTFVGEALHLRSPMLDMPFWRLYLLDVITFVVVLGGGYIYLVVQHFTGGNKKSSKSEIVEKNTKDPITEKNSNKPKKIDIKTKTKKFN